MVDISTKLIAGWGILFVILIVYFISNTVLQGHTVQLQYIPLSSYHENNTYNNDIILVNKSNNDNNSNYNILFVSMDTASLVTTSQNHSLHSWNTMSAALQFYYTLSHHGYDYQYYTLNKRWTKRNSVFECVNWRYKNGTYKFKLTANYCKILMLYHVLITYSHKYDFIVYMDSDAYIRTMQRSFKKWISKHFETNTHPQSITDYAMIFVSQKPYSDICTCLIIIPTFQSKMAEEMIKYWYYRIGYEKRDYWHANHVKYPKDQGVFNNQVYVVEKYKEMIYEIDEHQIYNCKKPRRYYRKNPFFIHFHSFLRRAYVAPRCRTYDLYYKSMKSVGIYENITNYAQMIQDCCVHVLNFTALQEFIYK